jgi:hypothetical protein
MGPRGWNQLDEDETAGMGADMRPVGSHDETRDTADNSKSDGTNSADRIELEERESGGSAATASRGKNGNVTEEARQLDGAGDVVADGDGEEVAQAVPREYKVYKRRWFGLVQLTLLNIIVSWGVSAIHIFRLCRLPTSQKYCLFHAFLLLFVVAKSTDGIHVVADLHTCRRELGNILFGG